MSAVLSGLRAWLIQRITAVYMLLFILYLLFHFITSASLTYAGWSSWVRNIWVSPALLFFFLAILIHTWVGIRDVILDYVNGAGKRMMMLSVVMIFLLIQALWVARLLFGAAG